MDKTGKAIQKRDNPNDVFITPDSLVEEHFNLVKPYLDHADFILDPCCHDTQKYFNKFVEKFNDCNGYGRVITLKELLDYDNTDYWEEGDIDWCEISMGRDFLKYDKKPDAIVGNPPYSMIDAFLDKSIELKPRVISYLIGFANITTKRLEKMEKAGYTCVEFHLTKVFKWYGMSLLIVWVRDTEKKSVIGYDRKVHR